MYQGIKNSLYRLKGWIEAMADKPHALPALFLIALVESSIFPIPPDVLLIAIATLSRKKAFPAALWCTLGSVIGGVIGYGIGALFMASFGQSIVEFYHAEQHWARIVEAYQGEWGIWFLVIAAFTPIPYKVSTIAAGATGMALLPFVFVSLLGRGARFFLVAGLLYFAGEPIRVFLDKYFDKLSIAFVLLLVGGFLAFKMI